MSGYAVAQIDEIDEIDDGRVLSRPVRFHFGITSFGVNAFTAHQVARTRLPRLRSVRLTLHRFRLPLEPYRPGHRA